MKTNFKAKQKQPKEDESVVEAKVDYLLNLRCVIDDVMEALDSFNEDYLEDDVEVVPPCVDEEVEKTQGILERALVRLTEQHDAVLKRSSQAVLEEYARMDTFGKEDACKDSLRGIRESITNASSFPHPAMSAFDAACHTAELGLKTQQSMAQAVKDAVIQSATVAYEAAMARAHDSYVQACEAAYKAVEAVLEDKLGASNTRH